MRKETPKQQAAFAQVQQAMLTIREFFKNYAANKPELLANAVAAIKWLWADKDTLNETRTMPFAKCCKVLDVDPNYSRRDMFLVTALHRTKAKDAAIRKACADRWSEIEELMVQCQLVGKSSPAARKRKSTATHPTAS